MKKKKVVKTVVTKSSGKPRIQPLGDRVLIKPFTAQEVKGDSNKHYGIILPDSMEKEKSAQGRVVSVGEGKYVEGKLMPINLKVGDIVLFSKYAYDEVELNGEELYILKEDNILAVIK